jgi:hypothetical protein
MRLFNFVNTKSCRVFMAILFTLLTGCGGGGGQDTILGTGGQSSNSLNVLMGSISSYGAFGGGAGLTNQGLNTSVQGDIGTTAACSLITGFTDLNNIPFTVTGLNNGAVSGNIYCDAPAPGTVATMALATKAASDALVDYNALKNMTPSTSLGPVSGQLAGLTVQPGVYYAPSDAFVLSTGNLTLDAKGDSNAVWIFQVPSSLTVGLIALPSSVLLINGGQAKNVYWQVGSAARIEDGSSMIGTIIAKAGVTISTHNQTLQTTLTGRAIGLNASVTMVNTTITLP